MCANFKNNVVFKKKDVICTTEFWNPKVFIIFLMASHSLCKRAAHCMMNDIVYLWIDFQNHVNVYGVCHSGRIIWTLNVKNKTQNYSWGNYFSVVTNICYNNCTTFQQNPLMSVSCRCVCIYEIYRRMRFIVLYDPECKTINVNFQGVSPFLNHIIMYCDVCIQFCNMFKCNAYTHFKYFTCLIILFVTKRLDFEIRELIKNMIV